MTTKLCRITAYWYGLMPIKPHELLSGYNLKYYISTTTVPMATKLGKLVVCSEGLLPIMLLYPLVKWSCEIAGQFKITNLQYHNICGRKT